MGDEVAGDRGDIPIPLTEAVRSQIVSTIETFPVSVRGTDVPQLVSFVEEALTVCDGDLEARPGEATFGPYTLASDAALEELYEALRATIRGARTVNRLLPPIDAAERENWRATHPWHDDLGNVAPALMRFGIPNNDQALEDAERLLKQAASLISDLFGSAQIDSPKPGNNKSPKLVKWVVRACAFYRIRQGLDTTSNWHYEKIHKGDTGRPEGILQPITGYDRLLCAARDAFRISVTNSTLRYEAVEYQRYLKGRPGRQPLAQDFTLFRLMSL